jgi:multisubunit Na+/H+ antiporter MnhB subunit
MLRGILLVALTTLFTFAVGTGLLALAVRRSRRWVRALLIAAALFAVVSAALPCRPLRTPQSACCWRQCTW